MKLKPAGKALIALLVIVPAIVFVYLNYFRDSLQESASSDKAETSQTEQHKPETTVAAGHGGEIKEVRVAKTDPQGNLIKDEAGDPVVEVRAENVYTVCLSEWPGHMAGVIACGGLTTQPGSYCSTVRSSYGDSPGVQLSFKFIEDPIAKNAALIKGECDFVWQTVDELPLNYAAYKEAGVDAAAFVQIDWSRGGDACVAANGIKSPRDLLGNGKGAALMSFTPDHTLYEYWITNSTLTPQEVNQLRSLTKRHDTDPTFGAQLFIKGQVDLACLWEPDVSNALRERAGSYRVFSTADATTLIADVLLARTTFLKKNPSVAEKVARVFLEGGRIGRQDKDSAAHLVSLVVPRFRSELGFSGTRKAFDWVRWNDIGDNVGMFGLDGSDPQFDVVYGQADSIWSEYKDPSTGDPVLSQKFMPHTLRDRSILARIYQEAEQERAASERAARETLAANPAAQVEMPAPIAPEKPQYDPRVAQSGKATLRKSVTINFDTGVSELDLAARSILKRDVLTQLRLAMGMSVRVEGNTDDVGPTDVNRRLSGKRAHSVKEFLIQMGVDPNRIASVGMGEANPICNMKTEDCRALNRRTDIVFVSAQ